MSNCPLQPTETILCTSTSKRETKYPFYFTPFHILDGSVKCLTFQTPTNLNGTFTDQILPQTPLSPQSPPVPVDPLTVTPTLNQSSSSGAAACLGRRPVKLPGDLKDYVLT